MYAEGKGNWNIFSIKYQKSTSAEQLILNCYFWLKESIRWCFDFFKSVKEKQKAVTFVDKTLFSSDFSAT